MYVICWCIHCFVLYKYNYYIYLLFFGNVFLRLANIVYITIFFAVLFLLHSYEKKSFDWLSNSSYCINCIVFCFEA